MNKRGFTLVELLMVVAVLAILVMVTVLFLNPTQFIAQGRDTRRISDLKDIDTAISLARNSLYETLTDNTQPNLVYVSLPDKNGTLTDDCGTNGEYTLPTLLNGWQYRCRASAANLRKVDSTGWIPIDFTSVSTNILSIMPVDPVNNQNNYYTYSWDASNASTVAAKLESEKYLASHANNTQGDGGNDDLAFETRPIAWGTVGGGAGTGTLTALGTIATGGTPNNINISSDGTSVYVTNITSGTVSMYSRNTGTGVLTALGTIAAGGTQPYGIAISADGTSVYVTNSAGGNTISMYSRNTGTGILTTLGTIAAGIFPRGIIISADGTSVYVTNANSSTVSMYSRNIGTGVLTALSTPTIATGTNPYGIAISADGTSVYVANANSNTVSMYSRNTGTGILTALGTPTISTWWPIGIAISADGTSVYVTNNTAWTDTVSMYSRNTGTGVLTNLGTTDTWPPITIDTGSWPYGIVISADGTSVYVTNIDSNTVSMYSRNTGTGILTALGTPTIATGLNPRGIIISADGTSVYVTNWNSNTVSMYRRN